MVKLACCRILETGRDPAVRINRPIATRLIVIGFFTGALSGFFGIGGGFLIVPGIMRGSGMPILNAIGSSLFSVGNLDEAPYLLLGHGAWIAS